MLRRWCRAPHAVAVAATHRAVGGMPRVRTSDTKGEKSAEEVATTAALEKVERERAAKAKKNAKRGELWKPPTKKRGGRESTRAARREQRAIAKAAARDIRRAKLTVEGTKGGNRPRQSPWAHSTDPSRADPTAATEGRPSPYHTPERMHMLDGLLARLISDVPTAAAATRMVASGGSMLASPMLRGHMPFL